MAFPHLCDKHGGHYLPQCPDCADEERENELARLRERVEKAEAWALAVREAAKPFVDESFRIWRKSWDEFEAFRRDFLNVLEGDEPESVTAIREELERGRKLRKYAREAVSQLRITAAAGKESTQGLIHQRVDRRPFISLEALLSKEGES